MAAATKDWLEEVVKVLGRLGVKSRVVGSEDLAERSFQQLLLVLALDPTDETGAVDEEVCEWVRLARSYTRPQQGERTVDALCSHLCAESLSLCSWTLALDGESFERLCRDGKLGEAVDAHRGRRLWVGVSAEASRSLAGKGKGEEQREQGQPGSEIPRRLGVRGR